GAEDDMAMPIVLALVLVAVFVGEIAAGAAGSERALVPLGALITRGWSSRDWWRVVTFSFLHLNWLHLALNTAGLLWLGRIVERRVGRGGLTAIFAAGGLASGVGGMLLGPRLPQTGLAVGAAGAVGGLLPDGVLLGDRGGGGRRGTERPDENPLGDRRAKQHAPAPRRPQRREVVPSHPARRKRRQRQPEQQMQVRPQHAARDAIGHVNQVVMIVPVDPEKDEAQDVGDEHGDDRLQR